MIIRSFPRYSDHVVCLASAMILNREFCMNAKGGLKHTPVYARLSI